MEKEISSGAMLGIVLIALAAIIGLGFGVFAIAKSTANEGVTKVQDNLSAVSDSDFQDYDQKIVTGTQVISALNNFDGKNCAVLIMTQANKDLAVTDEATLLTGNGVDSAYDKAGKPLSNYLVAASLRTIDADNNVSYEATSLGCEDSKGEEIENPLYINYNALLGADATLASEIDVNCTSGRLIYFDNNKFITTTTFEAKNGKVQFNNITANLSKSGMMEYVTSGARFQAYVIKDSSGSYMGVAFEQISV